MFIWSEGIIYFSWLIDFYKLYKNYREALSNLQLGSFDPVCVQLFGLNCDKFWLTVVTTIQTVGTDWAETPGCVFKQNQTAHLQKCCCIIVLLKRSICGNLTWGSHFWYWQSLFIWHKTQNWKDCKSCHEACPSINQTQKKCVPEGTGKQQDIRQINVEVVNLFT